MTTPRQYGRGGSHADRCRCLRCLCLAPAHHRLREYPPCGGGRLYQNSGSDADLGRAIGYFKRYIAARALPNKHPLVGETATMEAFLKQSPAPDDTTPDGPGT